MTTLQVRVASVRQEATDIAAFELHALDGGALPGFEAGAHIDVHLPDLPLRQYSLCNAPGETRRYVIAVLKEPASRGGSRHMHERLEAGDSLTISAPKNHFALAASAGRSLLIAGGIGVTPLLAMAESLAAKGADWQLHYCARSRDRMAFVARMMQAPLADHVHLHLDDGEAAQRLDLAALFAARAAADHLYICGPTGFLDWVKAAALAAGWPEAALHTEYFSGMVEHRDSDSAFELEIDGTDQVIRVAAGQTALDALIAAGIDVPNSCAEGVCGMCMTAVVTGTPDHRDQFLTTSERARNQHFMPCCSRSQSPRLRILADY